MKIEKSITPGVIAKKNSPFFGKESRDPFFRPQGRPFFSGYPRHAGEPPIQQKCEHCEREEKLQEKGEESNGTIRRKSIFESNDEASPQIERSLDASKGSGSPLPDQTRGQMENSFASDFSAVKIHTDERAVQMNKELGAQAFTHGNDIYFGSGNYNTDHTAGKHLLAHELTHVVQQGKNAGKGVRKSPKDTIQAKFQIATIFPDSNPPTDGQCHVFLGGRRIDHWSGYIPGMRHLYIDYYKNSSDYGVIEAGPVPPSATTGGGTSGAWVKPSTWESRGVQWEISSDDCPAFIDCLKTHTSTYNGAGHPYHATKGPNSNSFATWVLNECGVSASFLSSSYPYLGADYWQTHTSTAATGASTAPATP
jgi:hypothetical protein